MEKHYEGSNVLVLEAGAHTKSSKICIAFITIYCRSKIWQDTRRVTLNTYIVMFI